MLNESSGNPDLRVARMGDRLLAGILDSILLVIVYAVIGMATAAQVGGVTDGGFSLNGVPAAFAIGTTLLVGFLYYLFGEAIAGSTLGKGIAGIQVRMKAGGPCDMRGSMIRNLLRIVDVLGVYLVGFLVAIFSKSRQRLGDHVAGTIVVERNTSKLLRAVVIILWFAAIGGGLTGAYLIHKGAPETISGKFVPLPSTIPMTATGRLNAGNVAFTEGNNGPVRASAIYRPGNDVFIKYDVAGFGRDAKGVPHLSVRLTAADPAGLPIHEPWTIQFNDPLERGAPVNVTLGLKLPAFAPPGSYKIVTDVHDEVNGANLTLAPAFQVDAPAVAVPRGLEIRDFRFSHSDDGPPESDPGFEGGAAVYLNFNIFGPQFQNDRTSAHVSRKLTAPDGSVVLDDQDDLGETSDYRPATYWMHVRGLVTTPADAPKGVYTLQYSVTDNVSKQTTALETRFRIK